MNDPHPVPPMPRDFGWRYILWVTWCNALSILGTAQAILAMLALDPTLVSAKSYHYITLANAILVVVVAQWKKNAPPGPPPLMKGTDSSVFSNNVISFKPNGDSNATKNPPPAPPAPPSLPPAA